MLQWNGTKATKEHSMMRREMRKEWIELVLAETFKLRRLEDKEVGEERSVKELICLWMTRRD